MRYWFWLGLLSTATRVLGATVTNGGFESGLDNWRFWTREPKVGQAVVDSQSVHGGKNSVRVEHVGGEDWSLEPYGRLDVQTGDVFELEAWVRAEGEGTASLCASTWSSSGEALEWSHGDRPVSAGDGWHRLTTRLVASEGVVQIQPRVIGYGKLTLWVDDVSVRKFPGRFRPSTPLGNLVLSNQFLVVTVNASNAAFSVKDQRTGRTWSQRPRYADVFLQKAAFRQTGLDLELFHASSGLTMMAQMRLDAARPELSLEFEASGDLPQPLRFPHPFEASPGDRLILPMNEGISYPVEDSTVPLHRLIAYGGHGICMPFWGVTHGEAGQMCILETPDDAAIQMLRLDRRLSVAPEWESQKGAFGYARKLRYVFLDRGGHVAIAKRYRAHAKAAGLVKTLAEKRNTVPAVDLLVGAVNVWCWDKDGPGLVREMRSAGIDRILWSNRQSPTNLHALNEMGVLTSRYDIYQDVMNPAEFPRLQWIHPDWTTGAWPRNITIGSRNQWIKGWGVEARDGSMISCGVICDRQALPYARERVPADLALHPYKSRFIDTTTAAPWNECYSPDHPMTRTQSRQFKMDLLKFISQDMRLVTGCETGHDAAVPFLHYFEGMLSLGPYRVPDAGRRMQVIWTNVPQEVAKFQLGHDYRLPLWELVYHDCVVSQWYWGDYNSKLPALWDKRDLFNVLYGTPPMFMFDRNLWAREKERFAKSYRTVCPVVREVGYAEMTDHRVLTADRAVQQTAFASGHRITVNFGATAYATPAGKQVPGMGYIVERD